MGRGGYPLESDLFNLFREMSYSAMKSAEVFVWDLIQRKENEKWKLKAKIKWLEREIKSVRANRDYWREKAENNAKENITLKWKLENAYLELKIWSNWMADYMK